MNPVEIFNLIKGILLRPEQSWLIIKKFDYSWHQVYIYFTIPMVFLSSLAGLLNPPAEVNFLGLTRNWIFFTSFTGTLGGIAIAAWLISALAPRFLSLKSFNVTIALISFSFTPAFLANIISGFHSALLFLNFAGLVYMVYIFWRGTAVMLETPVFKLTGYVFINLIIILAVRVVLTSVIAAIVLSFTVGVENIPVK